MTRTDGGNTPYTPFLAQLTNWPCPHHEHYEPQRVSPGAQVTPGLETSPTSPCSQASVPGCGVTAEFPAAYRPDTDHLVSIQENWSDVSKTQMKRIFQEASIPCPAFLGQCPSPWCSSCCRSLGFLFKTKLYHITALLGNS